MARHLDSLAVMPTCKLMVSGEAHSDRETHVCSVRAEVGWQRRLRALAWLVVAAADPRTLGHLSSQPSELRLARFLQGVLLLGSMGSGKVRFLLWEEPWHSARSLNPLSLWWARPWGSPGETEWMPKACCQGATSNTACPPGAPGRPGLRGGATWAQLSSNFH